MIAAISAFKQIVANERKRKADSSGNIEERTSKIAVKQLSPYEQELVSYGIHFPFQVIGHGTHGRVVDGEAYVAKMCSPTSALERRNALSERDILQTLTDEKTPHIVPLIHATRSENKRYAIIMKKGRTNLSELYQNTRNPHQKTITIQDLQRIGKSVLTALQHLHAPQTGRKPIAHLDIKPDNILEDERGEISLIDFGSASVLNAQGTKKKYVFPRVFRPPEAMTRYTTHTWSDIWAFGATLFSLATNYNFLKDNSESSLGKDLQMIHSYSNRLTLSLPQLVQEMQLKKYRPELLDSTGALKTPYPKPTLKSIETAVHERLNGPKVDQLLDLFKQIFKINPRERPEAAQLLDHPFFKY